MHLTPDGERLFQRCQRVLSEIQELHSEASGTRVEPVGELRIDLPVYYGKRFVMPLLSKLLQTHPSLRLDIRLTDKQVDLVRDSVDLAVRIGPLRDSTLVARAVDRQELIMCASPAYLSAHGTPRRIEDLVRHSAITFRLPTSGRERPWQFRHRGNPVDLSPQSRVRIGETEGLVEALKLGMGICQIPDNLVQDELSSGVLVEILPSLRPASMPIHVIYPSGRLVPARVRVAIQALDALRQRRSRASTS